MGAPLGLDRRKSSSLTHFCKKLTCRNAPVIRTQTFLDTQIACKYVLNPWDWCLEPVMISFLGRMCQKCHFLPALNRCLQQMLPAACAALAQGKESSFFLCLIHFLALPHSKGAAAVVGSGDGKC